MRRYRATITGCITGCQSETQSICAVFLDDLQGIDAVTQRFTHLTALAVADKTVDQHVLKGNLAHLLQT